MLLKTRDFGDVEIKEQEVVEFKNNIFGFEDYKKFVFLHEDELGEEIAWLQSCEEKDLCFILISANAVLEDYKVKLSKSVREELGEGELEHWVIAVIKDDFKSVTVNLKSPIIFNKSRMLASQIIAEENFPISYPLHAKGAN